MTSSIYKIHDHTHNAEIVESITVTAPGMDYPSSQVEAIISGDGIGATAEVTKITGAIEQVNVKKTGINFSLNTQSAVSGAGSGATLATRTECGIENYDIENAGSGYSECATAIVDAPDQPGGTQATLELIVDMGGTIITVNSIIAGSGYTFRPTVTINDNFGINGNVVPDGSPTGMFGQLLDIRPTDGWTDYTNTDTGLVLTGYQSFANDATMDVDSVDANGRILTFTITNGGTGYQVGEIITVTGGSGKDDVIATVTTTGGGSSITALSISNGGTGYDSDGVNTITFSNEGQGQGGEGIVASIIGGIITVEVTNGGSGYTSATVAFTIGTGATADVFIGSISSDENIFEEDIVITNDMVKPGGGGILRLYFSFDFAAPEEATISIFNNNILKGNLNADNNAIVEDNGYYRFDIDVEAGDAINMKSNVDIDTVHFVRSHLVQFGA